MRCNVIIVSKGYFLWIDLSIVWGWLKGDASTFRFDIVEEKEGNWGQTVLEVLAEFFEASLVTCSHGALGSNFIIFGWVLRFFLPNRIFLINTLSIGFAATLWLRGTTHTESRDVQVNGSELFCNPLLIKSSIANSTPPMWLHFPFPRRRRPAGHVHAARSTS